MEGGGKLPSAFEALADGPFRRFWLGTLFTMFAVQIQNVALPWLAFEISGSGTQLGLVGISRGVAMLAVAPVGGALADRFPRKRVMLLSMAGLAVLAGLNALLLLHGRIEVWHLMVLGFAQSAVFAVHIPARQAHIPHLVGEANLANALALNGVALNGSRVTAPVLAGVLLTWSPATAFALTGVLFAACWMSMAGAPAGPLPRGQSGLHRQILEGFIYVWRTVPIRRVLLGVFVAVLLGGPFQFILPIFQTEELEVGPTALGAMYAATGIGSVIGSLLSAKYSSTPRLATIQWSAGIGFGLSLIMLAGAQHLAPALLVLVFVGLTSQGFMTINNVLLVQRSSAEMYGRVSAVYLMTWAMMPAGALPMGVLSDAFGSPSTFVLAGVVLTVTMVLLRASDRRSSPQGEAGDRALTP